MPRREGRSAASQSAASKRPPGRPARTDDPQKIAVLIPGELKKWLRITAIERGADMGDIVTEALLAYRRK